MKKTYRLIIVLSVLTIALVLMGCSDKVNIAGPKGDVMQKGNFDQTASIKTVTVCEPVVFPIWAGQNIEAGNVTVYSDDTYLYVTYNLTGGWMMTESHVHVGMTVNDIPQTNKGIPIPGQFQYSAVHNPPVMTYTYNILLADHNLQPGDQVVIAAHAVVVLGDYPNGIYQTQTGWGGDQPGPGPRWWYYLNYTICDDPDNDPDPDFGVETAMIRMYDNPNDFTFNWGNHPWFSYVKTTPVMTPQTYYFYAAQHYKVGEVEIWKDGGYLYVQLNLDNPYEIQQSHLNVQLTGYSGPPAFGLFPYTMAHDPRVTTYTYMVPWQPAWDNMELNVSLHGEVGPF